jgi:hypothetical protein
MNNDIITLLLNIANKRQHKLNDKTILVDGIEYIVFMDSCYFMLSPVNQELYERARHLIVPFDKQRAEERLKYKSIKVIG